MLMKLKVKYGYLLLLVMALSGCGSLGINIKKAADKYMPFYQFNGTELHSISLQSDADSNSNLPVALDILFIFDLKTAQALNALSGPDWFAGKQAMMLRYQQKMVLSELEIVPQSAEQSITLPTSYYNAVAVLLFANYIGPKGQYQADITNFSKLRVTLKNRGYVLEELNP